MHDDRQPIRQVDEPCPSCGSFYRRGDCCSRCETYAPAAPISAAAFKEGKAPRGRTWLKKEHRYLRQGEALPV